MGAAGRGGEGHIGFDKWTVKVPIWPPLWLFLPALLSTLVLYHLSFTRPLASAACSQCGSKQGCSETLTGCKADSPLQRRKRRGETGGGVYDPEQGLCMTWQSLSSHRSVWAGRRVGSR